MKRRLKKDSGYWYDVIVGGTLTFLILYLSGNLALTKLELTFWNSYYFIFCAMIVIFYQWKDDNLKVIKTPFIKRENFELTKETLEALNWTYREKATEIELTYNKYFLKFLKVTIIPQSENIYFNFQYHSTTKAGRLPFYLGICTIMEWRFKMRLKSLIKKKQKVFLGL